MGVPGWELSVSDGLEMTTRAPGGYQALQFLPGLRQGFVLPCGDHPAAARRRMRGKLWGSAGGRNVGMELEAELGQGWLWLLEGAGSCGILVGLWFWNGWGKKPQTASV